MTTIVERALAAITRAIESAARGKLTDTQRKAASNAVDALILRHARHPRTAAFYRECWLVIVAFLDSRTMPRCTAWDPLPGLAQARTAYANLADAVREAEAD